MISLVSASRLTCGNHSKAQRVSQNERIEFGGESRSTHFFGCLDCDKVIVDLLGFGGHLLRFRVLVLFAGQPKLQVLVAEFADQESAIQGGSVCETHKQSELLINVDGLAYLSVRHARRDRI